MHKKNKSPSAAFTLVELLVVIGIIGVLIGLLIPVANKVRRASQAAAVQNQISVIGQAVENYFHDFHAYPGPVANVNIGPNQPPGSRPDDQIVVVTPPGGGNLLWAAPGQPALTMSENLVLGVIGGLEPNPRYVANQNNAAEYNPALIFGQGITQSPPVFAASAPGPLGLNPALPKHYGSYMPAQDLSDGFYHDGLADQIKGAGNGLKQAIDDTMVPEFLDRFPYRMPILYLRARVGAAYNPAQALNYSNNNVITYDPVNNARPGQYDISQIIAYTQSYKGGAVCIGEGKTVPSKYYVAGSATPVTVPYHGLGGYANGGIPPVDPAATMNPSDTQEYYYPYNAYPYFTNPSLGSSATATTPHSQDVPRNKDGYILISAGPDRMYGTSDDICSFGNLQQ